MNIFQRLFGARDHETARIVTYSPVCAQCAQFRAVIHTADVHGNRKLANDLRLEHDAHCTKAHGDRHG
jgi:predicted DCC family thiol-disulfide oxidoreductase YuxK